MLTGTIKKTVELFHLDKCALGFGALWAEMLASTFHNYSIRKCWIYLISKLDLNNENKTAPNVLTGTLVIYRIAFTRLFIY